jgi:hypothetical protein
MKTVTVPVKGLNFAACVVKLKSDWGSLRQLLIDK